jgi:O-antigen/teichoic acid export membrane protein
MTLLLSSDGIAALLICVATVLLRVVYDIIYDYLKKNFKRTKWHKQN